jgi:hypothetical protein
MAPLKQKGDRAELEVARDLVRRGYRIAIPYGEDWDFDLIFQRPDSDALERVQVKHVRPNGNVIRLEARSASLTKGKVKRIKCYTAATIDWLAAFEPTSNRCYYIPAAERGNGMDQISLRLAPTRNFQRRRVRYAEDYVDPVLRAEPTLKVEPAGLEPAPSALQTPRSPN